MWGGLWVFGNFLLSLQLIFFNVTYDYVEILRQVFDFVNFVLLLMF